MKRKLLSLLAAALCLSFVFSCTSGTDIPEDFTSENTEVTTEAPLPSYQSEMDLQNYLVSLIRYFNDDYAYPEKIEDEDILTLLFRHCLSEKDHYDFVSFDENEQIMYIEGEGFFKLSKLLFGEQFDCREYYGYFENSAERYIAAEDRYAVPYAKDYWGGINYVIETPEITTDGLTTAVRTDIVFCPGPGEDPTIRRTMKYVFDHVVSEDRLYYRLTSATILEDINLNENTEITSYDPETTPEPITDTPEPATEPETTENAETKVPSKRVGWYDDGVNKKYYDANGILVTGWQQIGGKSYYFSVKDGTMAKDTDIGFYHLDSEGVATLIQPNHDNIEYYCQQLVDKCGTSPSDIFTYIRKFGYKAIESSGDTADNAVYLLNYHRGSCYQFAALSQYMLTAAGFETVMVQGKGLYGAPVHYWNMVCVNGKWYHFDALQNRLLKTDEFMIEDGYNWDRAQYPACTG